MGRSRTGTDPSAEADRAGLDLVGPLDGFATRLGPPVGIGVLGLAAVAAVGLHDPHVPGSWGVCPFLAVTGYYCPGCGGLRAVNDLVHLHPLAAVSSNVLAVLFVVLGSLGWAVWFFSRLFNRRIDVDVLLPRWAGFAALAVVVVFTVVRNTPWGAWLAP